MLPSFQEAIGGVLPSTRDLTIRGDDWSELMSNVLKLVSAVHKDEEGAALVEYALLIGLIAVVCIIAVTQLGLAISGKLNTACNSLGGSAC